MSRTLDILISTVCLLGLSLFFILLAILIKIDSAGPVFFRQKRIGKKLVPFYIIKFRTMGHRDSDSIDQHAELVVANNDDKRITSIGKYLRKTSLDELPQLINILVGDMSLVGPRPIIPEQLEALPYWFSDRFNVKPGITGLAQIKGRRSLSWEEQLKHDTEYARNQTILGDIKILFLTLFVVLTRKGIYGDESKNWRSYRKDWAHVSMAIGRKNSYENK